MFRVNGGAFAPVVASEQDKVFATLVSAFARDPWERWAWPEDEDYLTQFPEFLAAFGGRAFEANTVWRLGDFAAVALWLPPGSEPDGEAIFQVLTATVPTSKHDDTFAVLGQMDQAHPRTPHWYLPWFGVVAAHQGEGLGGLLMRECLRVVDASHLPAYLETPNPRTVSFYSRHGFEVTGQAQVGASPPIIFMARSAQ